MEFYINRGKVFKTILKSLSIAIIGLIVLFALNFIVALFSSFFITPFILAVPSVYALITIYRSIWLIWLPEFIINDSQFKCFNILWYNTHKWDNFDIIEYSKDNYAIELKLNNGNVIDKIDLSTLKDDNIEIFLSEIKKKKTLNYL